MDRPLQPPRQYARIDFKPREFFAGIAVAAVVVALCVAVTRSYTRARTIDTTSMCQACLRQLQTAKDIWARDHARTSPDAPTWTDIVGPKAYIAQMPVCPKGGTYTLGPVGEKPRCSIPDHSLP